MGFGEEGVAEKETVEKDLDSNLKNKFSHQSSNCSIGKKTFNLHLGSEFQKPDSEMKQFGYNYFWISAPGKAPIAAIPAKEYNELFFLKPIERSICKNTVAHATKNGEVVIFFRQNNRPFADQLGVLLYDTIKNQILFSNRGIAISQRVEKTKSGLSFLVSDWATEVTQYEVSVRGQQMKAKEQLFLYWNYLELQNDQLKTGFDRVLTWSRALEKRYFKNQETFEKAIGYDLETEKISAVWVFSVNKPDCIQFSRERHPSSEESQWHCKP
jgi:hypothetical protein